MKIKVLDMQNLSISTNIIINKDIYKKWWDTLPETKKSDKHLQFDSPFDKILYKEEYDAFKNFEYFLKIEDILK